MKRIKSIATLIVALCLLLTSCVSSSSENDSIDYSATLGDNIRFFNEPTEEYVIECLKNVATINGIAAVTEENDPNGKLNKDGGYISAVYFSSSLVQQDTFTKNELIEKGTSAGGCIEVFKTVEDANARNEYLSEFDGGLLDSGSHVVIDTVIIRVSSSLDDTQQKKLEEDIVNAFVTVEDATNEGSTTVTDETVSEIEESTTEESTTEESTTESTTKKAETTTKKQETTTKKPVTTTKPSKSEEEKRRELVYGDYGGEEGYKKHLEEVKNYKCRYCGDHDCPSLEYGTDLLGNPGMPTQWEERCPAIKAEKIKCQICGKTLVSSLDDRWQTEPDKYCDGCCNVSFG